MSTKARSIEFFDHLGAMEDARLQLQSVANGNASKKAVRAAYAAQRRAMRAAMRAAGLKMPSQKRIIGGL